MSFPRPLTDPERRLVLWMIEHGDADPESFLAQLDDVVVVSQCTCGCASIDFQVGNIDRNCGSGLQIISDYLYGPKEVPLGAFVFACNGVLAGLEVYSFTETPAALPAPEELRAFGPKPD